MKLPRNVEYTNKINNCIDDLLMEDTTFYQQTRKLSYQSQSNKIDQQKSNRIGQQQGLWKQSQRKQKLVNLTNYSQQHLYNSIKQTNQTQTYNNNCRYRKHANFHKKYFHQKQQSKPIISKKQITKTLPQQQDNKNIFRTETKQKISEQEFNMRRKKTSNLKLKKTYSIDISEDQFQHVNQLSGNDSHSPEQFLRSIGSNSDSNLLVKQFNSKNEPIREQGNIKFKHNSSNLKKNRSKLQFKQNLTNQQSQQQQQQQQQQNKYIKKTSSSSQSGQFHLSHQQLQFLSLLYPNESPQSLMLKLLSYYQQQQDYNNSFQHLFQMDQLQKSNQFFRTKQQINFNTPDYVIEMQSEEQQQNNQFIKCQVTNQKLQQNNNNSKPIQNNYSKLKQQCLAALGQQMVQTQIKSSLTETANVNYYTRQYAMPIIMQTISQKNYQAQQKLQKLEQHIKQNQQKMNQRMEQITMTINQQKIAAVLAQNNQSVDLQLHHIPTEFIHKVFIPVNSRGQSFQMDYKPDSKLFEYISENDYRRILRDINHLIQKVLSYHRHSSFLKKKNSSLLRGWNLTLLIFLFVIIAMLYARCFFAVESGYLQIVVFFCLSFIVILILGNSFNNYKKNVKRSSVIRDICEQVSKYLDFINTSNKNIKWILGKDFFWLQIWVDVLKNSQKLK